MRTLFVAPQVPWPLDVGSKIRIYNLVKSYASAGPVTLLCIEQSSTDRQALAQLAAVAQTAECFRTDAAIAEAGKLAAVRQLLRPVPKSVRAFRSSSLSAHIEMLLERERFDVMHVQRLSMTANISATAHAAAKALKVLDLDDIESAKALRGVRLESWHTPRRYVYWAEYAKLERLERRAFAAFDRVLVCSAKDQERLLARGCVGQVQVFENGADLDGFADTVRDNGRTLVFFGAMDYQPNEDAAMYFARHIFPLVKREVQDARFVIAGKAPSERIRALHDGRGIEVQGYVRDKRELFGATTVLVVPIRVGGGTRIKILEAMAAQRPVVSTSVGCEGIDVSTGENILVGDSPQAFAACCVELLRNEDRRRALGSAGQELVTRRYQWSAIRERFISSLLSHQREPDVMQWIEPQASGPRASGHSTAN